MKKILLLALTLKACIGFSQAISFDNYISSTNNDLVNNFDGAYTFTQITSNGITGGCVNVPTTGMSDVARYKPKYKWNFTQANPFKVSVCFKYVGASDLKDNIYPTCQFQLRQYDSATSTETGHFIDAMCDYEQISMNYNVTLSSSGYLPPYFYLPDSWFKFEFYTYNINQDLYMVSKLYDLGANGLAAPILMSTVSNNDTSSFPSNLGVYYQMWMVGYHSYGAQYLDNFNITSNFSTGTNDVVGYQDFQLSSNGNSLSLDNLGNKMVTLNVYDISGQKLFTSTTSDSKSYFDISSFANGIYFAEIVSNQIRIRMEKFTKYE